ncbi:MAG: chitobiase/beta-hexosaminidase C-terminal domain-containing protein [Alteromonadaceae bacterium]|nr:chitobiase/beta-hexosaminidase C-terminal domain-containing protein [Alteromonadaceae bacterium]
MGDWSENYPTGDYAVTSNKYYKINFNVLTHAIMTTEVTSCTQPTGFVKTFSQLYARGTFNGWASTSMNLVADHTWQVDVSLDGQANQRLKFDVNGDWSQDYGDTNTDNILEQSGADIYVSGAGNYRLAVNDQTLVYSVSVLSTANQAPIAVISPSTRVDLALGASVVLDGQSSIDNDGTIVNYSWSTGDTTVTTTINGDSVGSFTVSLTVTDDQGATGTSNVTVNVTDTPADAWYFRGSPNNWATTLMASSDGVNYCIEQVFANVNPRFKIDHFADWVESYPTADYIVTGDSRYQVCFNATSHAITTTLLSSVDLTAPVVSASPNSGVYTNSQNIILSVTDNQDANPQVYYTTDNSTPTINSPLYSGQTLTATDITTGVDLVVKTLAVDVSGNQAQQSFSYQIGAPINSGDFREETIYFLMTTRFYDGDPTNNYYNRDRYKAGDPQWRGDYKGLIAQLDYIKDLGFTAIWSTPPVENRSGLDYHGYHAYDFYRVDPRLESAGATYQDFINAAHAKGLKVIQDVVINHSSQYGLRGKVWIDHLPVKYYVPAGATQGSIDNGPYQGNLGDYASVNRDDNDNSVAPDWFKARHNSDPEGLTPLVDPKTGVTVPLAGYDANRFFGIDAQGLDPAWYHLDGFMAGGDWENPTALQNKHMAGDTIDLATGNQNVKDYINGAINMYLDMGVDAIRLDTVKHVERDELLTYVHEWQAHKPGLFVFGENLVKGTGWGSEIANDNASAVIRPWWYTRTTQDPSNPNAGGDSGFSVLDFSLFSTFRDNVTRGSFNGIGGILSMDWIYGDATKLVTFFQNHDVGPDNDFKYRFGGSEANAALVYNLLWTIRGIPTLYYGEEVMFQAGLPQDIANANDTLDQTGRAYYGPTLDNLAATQAHPLYQHIKRLNQIRKAIPALQKAPMSQVNEWGAGMSFVRDLSAQGSYAAVGLATGSGQNITMSGVVNGTYVDAVSGGTINVSNGSLSFNVPAYSARIWVLNGSGKIGVDGVYLK